MLNKSADGRMATDRCESSRKPNDESGDRKHDGPFNWLGKNNSLLTSTGLLMEGTTRLMSNNLFRNPMLQLS